MREALAYQPHPQLEFDFSKFIVPRTSDGHAPSAKPFIKWAGGKGQLIPSLFANLPSDFDETVSTYIEPFIGGGAFLFWLLSHGKRFRKVLINDANQALVNAYQVIRDNPEKLISLLNLIRNEYISLNIEEERKLFYYRKRDAFNSGNDTPLQHAAHLIFLNRTCFNGLFRVNAKGKFNVPHGRYANPLICDPDTIFADSQALSNVEIHCGDFSSVLADADKDCFIYFDPPYRPVSETSSFCSYCKGGFDDDEQRRLAQCCHTLNAKGVRWLLSNSDPRGLCPDEDFFERLYQGFHIQRVQANRMLNAKADRRGKLNELLIRNYCLTKS